MTDRGNLLEGNLPRTVLLLALPVLCEQVLGFLVGFYDTWLSGRISAEATAAVGLAAYVGWLASMLFGLVATGTTALVARHWGAGETDQANRVTNRSIALAGLAGLGVYGLVYLLAPVMAGLLEMQGETGRIVVNYLRIDGIGHVVTGMTLAAAAAMRGAGNMRTPMFVLGFVSILNAVVSTVLVFGAGPLRPWGIDGIVVGTLVARIGGGLLMLLVLVRGVNGLRLVSGELRVRGETGRRILRIGGPAALDGLLTWIGQFLFLMIIARLESGGRSSSTFAAHIIGVRVEGITYLPAVAWGAAAATLVGQSLGAGLPQRALQAGHAAARQCGVLAVVIGLVFLVTAPGLFALMHSEAEVAEIGTLPFRVVAFFQLPLALSIVYVAALRGAGETRYPMMVNLLGVFGVRLPVAALAGLVLDGGLMGAWIGMCADVTVRAGLLLAKYFRGGWIQTQV